ncbi:MAG: pilus assembly protein PilO [Proteobacteria bacterium]|nr:pilus assembly protein PilO [Pseudomonadota bacterium]
MNIGELKNIDLKNIDVKEIFAKLKINDLFKDKKFVIKFSIYFFSILVFLIIYYAIVNPKVNDQKQRIAQMQDNELKIVEYKNNISQLGEQIKNIQPEYEKKSKLFHDKKEVEDLYQNISNFASVNGLSILKLNKENATPVSNTAEGSNPNPDQGNSTEGQPNPDQGNSTEGQPNPGAVNALYYKIPVNFEIKGNYLGYLKFRRALAQSNKAINFDNEKITVNQDATINAQGIISIVGLPDDYK